MDPMDHLDALPDGMPCSVCGERVPGDGIRLLAWRDDLAFLQLECPGCLSTTLGFTLGGQPESPGRPEASGPTATLDVGVPALGPISSDDVLDMHQFLAAWGGDLASLVRTSTGAGRRSTDGTRRDGSP
jgi:hypothetical protein